MLPTKDQCIRLSSSIVFSWITIGGFLWLFVEPILVNSVSEALAGDIDEAVSRQIAPLNGAFIALLQRDIDATKKEIAMLEFRRERNGEDWIVADAKYLIAKEIELKALLKAIESLENT